MGPAIALVPKGLGFEPGILYCGFGNMEQQFRSQRQSGPSVDTTRPESCPSTVLCCVVTVRGDTRVLGWMNPGSDNYTTPDVVWSATCLVNGRRLWWIVCDGKVNCSKMDWCNINLWFRIALSVSVSLSLSVRLSSISSPVISGAKLINSLIFHVEATESWHGSKGRMC